MDKGAWWAIVQAVRKSWTWLTNLAQHIHTHTHAHMHTHTFFSNFLEVLDEYGPEL